MKNLYNCLTILNSGKILTIVRGLLSGKKLLYNHPLVNYCLLYEKHMSTGNTGQNPESQEYFFGGVQD
jgi:hypothetical protein